MSSICPANNVDENFLSKGKLMLYLKSRKTCTNRRAVTYFDENDQESVSYHELYIIVKKIASEINELLVNSDQDAIVAFCIPMSIYAICFQLALIDTHSYFYVDPHTIGSQSPNPQLLLVKPNLFVIDEEHYFFCNWLKTDYTTQKHFYVLGKGVYVISMNFNFCEKLMPCKDLAYVITTTGTTGCPKLVYVPRKCIAPNVADFVRKFKLTSADIIFNAASLSFDPSIVNILTSVYLGAELVIVSGNVLFTKRVVNCIIESKVSFIQVTPSLLCLWDSLKPLNTSLFSKNSHINVIALGGESVPEIYSLKRWTENRPSVKIFSLYGITEVSSWATIAEISTDSEALAFIDKLSNCITYDRNEKLLGDILSETFVSVVRDGHVVDCGEGEIYIGRQHGCIVINAESVLKPFCKTGEGNKSKEKCIFHLGVQLVPSGDRGIVKNGALYFAGRLDRVVKYFGKKVCLDLLEVIIRNLNGIKQCCMLFFDNFLHCFIVKEDAVLFSAVYSEIFHAILLPFKLLILEYLPVNTHGKVDYFALKHRKKDDSCKSFSKEILKLMICDFWKQILKCEPTSNSNFATLGGNSMQAVQLVQLIEDFTSCSVFESLDSLITDTFDVFINKVCSLMHEKMLNCSHFLSVDDAGSEVPNKIVEQSVISKSACNSIELSNSKCKLQGKFVADVILTRNSFIFKGAKVLHEEHFAPKFAKLMWEYDMIKCIDSSPVLVSKANRSLLFVASHSGLFCCLDAATRYPLWTVQLKTRTETTVAVNLQANFVYVGCYAGVLYCFSVEEGELLWQFKTGAEIKSSPLVDFSTGNIYFGCHDRYFYCISSSGDLIWKAFHSGASIYGSACITDKCVIVACLRGLVASYCKLSGTLQWNLDLGMPVFSSVSEYSRGVVVSCVDKCVYAISYDGVILWKYDTGGHCYCTPAVIDSFVFTANNEGNLTVLSELGVPLGNIKLCGKIVAMPFIYKIKSSTYSLICALAVTSGKVIFIEVNYVDDKYTQRSEDVSKINYISNERMKSGIIKNDNFQAVLRVSLEISVVGELFSSPLVHGNKLYICSRDNKIRCYSLSGSSS